MPLSPAVLSILATLFICVGIALVFFLMRPRRFYFVRHGETLLNAAHIKQGEAGGLSEAGKQQATAAGTLLVPLRIQAIISSPYERAQETADTINELLHTTISYSSLLAERRNPSDIIGKDRDDPTVAHIVDQMDLAYHDDSYRYGNEENFQDLKTRARKCIGYLARHGATRTCVVTHHAFLKMLLSYMLYRETLHARDYVKLSFFNQSDNGGVSICEFHPWKLLSPTHGWEVISYNEQPE